MDLHGPGPQSSSASLRISQFQARSNGRHLLHPEREGHPSRSPHRRRKVHLLSGARSGARRAEHRRLAADLADAGPGRSRQRARYTRSLPQQLAGKGGAEPSPLLDKGRIGSPALCLPRKAREPESGAAGRRDSSPTPDHRRGPLHRRMGARLPPQLSPARPSALPVGNAANGRVDRQRHTRRPS